MTTFNPNDSDGIEAARLFRAAFGHLKHGVIIYNNQLKVLEINDRVRELLDLSPADFANGDNFEKLVRINAARGGYGGNGDIEKLVEWRMSRARSFEPFHEDQLIFNGRHVEVYGQPIPDGGYVLTYTDITDRAKAELAKNEFLARMSHDIRTPINAVVGMAELLDLSELSEQQSEMISTIMRSSKVLLRLVDDILDLAQLESNTLTLEEEPFRLHDVLQDVVATLQVLAEHKNVRIKLDMEKGFPDTIIGDPIRLAQCVINLLGNAIKYSGTDENDSKEVSIRVASTGQESFSIAVSDQGFGIETHLLDSIFEPFSQGELQHGRQPEGTGLGLAIVSELVRLMEGEVSVTSEIHQGSTFTLQLPLVITSDSSEQSAETLESRPANTLAMTKRERILVVEDNVDNRQVLTMQLELLGQDVEIACNGEEGIAKWRDGNFAMILSDCNMPVLDGLAMTQAIRKEETSNAKSETPVIAITGNAIASDLQNCFDAGMNDYLVKPLTINDLREKLERFLD